jgi:alkylation response protein AidB-like acyl-CoA dehydrogenase
MDFALTEEQEMLKRQAREFLENECPKTLVREMEENEKGYSPELWDKIIELGWLGLPFPEDYDGMEMSFLDLTVILEEMGRALVPGPYVSTVVLGGLTILDAGTEEQKSEFLPKIANGEINLTMALMEENARYDAAGIEMEAAPSGDDYILNGTKLFVFDANVADWILCAARTKKSENKEDGITLFLVDGKSSGVTVTPLKTVAADKQCEIVFDNVKVPKSNIVGELDQGWKVVAKTLEKAAIAECALMLGGAQQALDMTVDYAKERVQFGRPIGKFQAIQHKCAEMLSYVEGMRFITYQAAWMLSEGLPCTLEVAEAKTWCGEASKQVCQDGLHVHGAIAFTKDHDLELYFRRQKIGELSFGDISFQREVVAQQMGL